MKVKYDIVFFTNVPAFYKINLYNEISKQKKVLVIFISEFTSSTFKDFTEGKLNFEYIFLNKEDINKRNKLKSCVELIRILYKIKYNLIITMGWSTLEDFVISFFSPKNKNGLICESSIYESNLDNWKKYLKKLICFRMSYAFVSGELQRDI